MTWPEPIIPTPFDPAPSMPTMKILVVDDHRANIDVMLSFLDPEGYDLSVALSGSQALKIASHIQPDLILLDVMMPEMDGFDTCHRLKQDPTTNAIPVIFVTARKENEDIVRGFQCGGVDYIAKPFRQEEVRARVATHLHLCWMRRRQQQLITQLQGALAEVKTLTGLLPICSSCKKIREGKDNWQAIEAYISARTEADFSHSICPDCARRLYPELNLPDTTK